MWNPLCPSLEVPTDLSLLRPKAPTPQNTDTLRPFTPLFSLKQTLNTAAPGRQVKGGGGVRGGRGGLCITEAKKLLFIFLFIFLWLFCFFQIGRQKYS